MESWEKCKYEYCLCFKIC